MKEHSSYIKKLLEVPLGSGMQLHPNVDCGILVEKTDEYVVLKRVGTEILDVFQLELLEKRVPLFTIIDSEGMKKVIEHQEMDEAQHKLNYRAYTQDKNRLEHHLDAGFGH